MSQNKLLKPVRVIVTGLISSFLLSTALSTQALPEDAQQEMTILSDSAEYDGKAGIVIYKGNVVLTQGTMTIKSERLMIIRNGKALEKAVAEGKPATYQQQIKADQGMTTARGNRIDYFATRKEVLFTGQAHMQQEGNEFSGKLITFDIDQERVRASSGISKISEDKKPTGQAEQTPQRIKVIIQPEQVSDSEQDANENP